MAGKIKITKQFIISQTILYVFIMAFVITFRMIFGDKNILIGVMGITAILMLTQINLTVTYNKFRNRYIYIYSKP